MAKVKHPRKALGILKMTAFLAPLVLGLGGVSSALGTGIAYRVKSDDLMKEYTQSAVYEQQYNYDKDEANRAYEAGEIKHLEYDNLIAHIGTDKYVEEVMNMDLEGNEEYQARAVQNKKIETALFATLGIGVAGLGGIIGLLFSNPDKQWDKLMKDIEYYVVDNSPKKQAKQIDDETESEEEVLPSIEDDYYKE